MISKKYINYGPLASALANLPAQAGASARQAVGGSFNN